MTSLRKTGPKWRALEHTADLRLEIRGASFEELFVNAAEALTSFLSPGYEETRKTEIEVSLSAESLEDLLVDWLREVLFQSEARGLAFSAAHFEELSQTRLKARVSTRPTVTAEEPELEIKAVTYHGLSVEESDTGYVARIIFDV